MATHFNILAWKMPWTEEPSRLQSIGSQRVGHDLAISLSFPSFFAPWKKSCDQPRHYIKKQRHYFANKGTHSQNYGFSSSHVWMWELDRKEGWALKNGCFQIVVLEKTLESPLGSKEIKPVNPKGNQSWILIGRTDTEAPILWPPDGKNWLIRKDFNAEKDWRQEEETREDEMVGWTWVWGCSRSW